MKFKSKAQSNESMEARIIAMFEKNGPMSMSEVAAKLAGVDKPTLEQWLQFQAIEWAMDYVRAAFPGAQGQDETLLLTASESSFVAGTLLACHALKRGKMDKTYNLLWERLLAGKTASEIPVEPAPEQGDAAISPGDLDEADNDDPGVVNEE